MLHPRPQFRRSQWLSLDGPWDFCIDAQASYSAQQAVPWSATIEVPFAPETERSGIADTGFYRCCWYRRDLPVDRPPEGERWLLHFGAVDYEAAVWINDRLAVRHEGGYTPFHVDISDLLLPEGNVLFVRAEDDPHDLAKPRGKQDWQLHPHSIWYPRTTGIWQTVWLERVAATWLSQVRWTPSPERWELGLEARLAGIPRGDLDLHVRLFVGETVLADDSYRVVGGEVHRRIGLSDPGIDDYRNELLWSPSSPTLIHARLTLKTTDGQTVDAVESYTALRSIGVQGDRFVLNGRPYPLRLILDQGYWPESGATAPSAEALRRDVELAKVMGFNGVRKHQKIEDPRYLYWADTLGLLVWEEMPSAYRFSKQSIERLAREWMAVIERDANHPCIVAWVPFNESWGVPNLPDNPAQRHYVQGLYHLTKTLDPTRPVVGNDGWESVATDIIGIHDYDDSPHRILHRYGGEEPLPRLFQRERPAGRLLVLGEQEHLRQPIVLSEFGGIACSADGGSWGYSRAADGPALANQYSGLVGAVASLSFLAGFCYTQFSDTYQETNGLLYADRTPKFPFDEIAKATRGVGKFRDQELESVWRERLMDLLHRQYQVPAADYRIQEDR